MKIFFGILILVGVFYLVGQLADREAQRFQALSTEQKYRELCEDEIGALVMAQQSAQRRLNIVDFPKLETTQTFKPRTVNGDCIFTIVGPIIYKNEFGGQSRKYMNVVLTPDRSELRKDHWSVLSVEVR